MCKELFELLLQFGNIIRSKNGGYYSENYTAVWRRMERIHNSHFGLSKKNTVLLAQLTGRLHGTES